MRLATIFTLLTLGIAVAACGGSDNGGILSGKNDTSGGAQGTTSGTGDKQPADARALATVLAQTTGGAGNPTNNLPVDARALATVIAPLTNGTGSPGNNFPTDAGAIATVIAQLGGTGNLAANLPTGNAAATPDPCALLTLDDAMTALKTKDLKKGKDVNPLANVMGTRECSYESQGTNNFSSISLTVVSTAGMAPQMRTAGYNAKKQFDELKRLNKNPIKVDGIGEDAWLDGRFIHVLKRDVTFDLLVFTNGDASDALKAAATKIAGKLP